MNFAETAIEKKTITLVLTLVLVVGGLVSYNGLGRLEDPEFTIKDALIITQYPGASAAEVEEEVTDRIELAVQQLGQLKEIRDSVSMRGLSIVKPRIKDKYDKDSLPQVWDELRRKVADVQANLPPGAGPSIVNDDFGDVFGIFVAVYGDEYSYAELKNYVDFLRRELALIPEVAKVQTFGEVSEAVYVEVSRVQLSEFGIPLRYIIDALRQKNMVADSGRVHVGTEYITIEPTGVYTTVKEFESLLISTPDSDKLIYLKDIATVTRDYINPPDHMLRYNGHSAIGLGISTVSGGNVVVMGEALQARMKELESTRPIGIEFGVIAMQSTAVKDSIDGFLINLLEAVVIVIVVLFIFMGVRSGLLIGSILFITIAGTFIGMSYLGTMLERISLGALIIALGMLVDNAIVVTDGTLMGIQKGNDAKSSAIAVVKQTSMPLLGATLVAILAFAAIGTSEDNTGEFCRSLFQVILISLLLSWVTAVTITPLFCVMFLKDKTSDNNNDNKSEDVAEDLYGGSFYETYAQILRTCLSKRGITIGVAGGLLITAIWGFGFVDSSFFPDATRPQFMIDVWAKQGTHIRDTEKIVADIEDYVHEKEGVTNITSIIGKGAMRIVLTYAAERSNTSYAQLLVDVDDFKRLKKLVPELQSELEEKFPDIVPNIKLFLMGPGEGGKIQVRVTGSDSDILRGLADGVEDILHNDGGARGVRMDWRQRVKVIRPEIAEEQARNNGIDRPDIAKVLQASYDGTTVGVYREQDLLLPIILRAPESERVDIGGIANLSIWSNAAHRMIPLRQVVSGLETTFEDEIIFRKNRRRTIIIHADARTGYASALLERVMPKIDSINLPQGYLIDYGGEYEDSINAQAGLIASLPFFTLAMVIIVIMLFNSLKQPLVIFLCVPLALIGVAAGLLLTDQPFGFMALLGLLSLSGMLIKNAVVLVDQIDLEIREGKEPFVAIIDSAKSRLRPVGMAAATTVLGMIPLLFDAFFISMAVTIIFGLIFATVLTLLILPVFYAVIFKIPFPDSEART